MSGCNHDKCLRDGCKFCCYCTTTLDNEHDAWELERIDAARFMEHGCLIGDCPHDKQYQCDEELTRFNSETLESASTKMAAALKDLLDCSGCCEKNGKWKWAKEALEIYQGLNKTAQVDKVKKT